MTRWRSGGLVAALTSLIWACSLKEPPPAGLTPHEDRITVGGASLYVRTIGHGRDVIVLHGGPDFDHRYLLPDLDRLADRYRLTYYDQRGRGQSAENVNPTNVTIASEVDDLDHVRQYLGRDAVALLGHSWGAVLALEYAIRHPERVSHLVLMNPAPASTADVAVFRQAYLAQLGADMDRQRQLASSAGYRDADPAAVTARYRVHFEHALARPADYEKLIAAMNAAFEQQGAAGILKARAVEDHLMAETWQIESYDLLPKLHALTIPTLVITGDHDFIPVEIARHIAAAIPNATLATLENCGHFAYLECPGDLQRVLAEFRALR